MKICVRLSENLPGRQNGSGLDEALHFTDQAATKLSASPERRQPLLGYLAYRAVQ